MSSSDKFSKYTVPQLKQYLQERGVTVSGYRRPLLLELANAVDRVQLLLLIPTSRMSSVHSILSAIN